MRVPVLMSRRTHETLRGTMLCIIAFAIGMMVCFAGCDSGGYETRSRENTSESYRQDVVDHMVGQGADRTEADVFTNELFKAQREWEAENGL